MTEYNAVGNSAEGNNTVGDSTTVDRHRSGGMGFAGLAALLVAAWCLAGGPETSESQHLPWILLAVGVAVGVGMIVSGFARK
ncbi:hypothetical protein [Gordonia sp. (in: high G+C Gram-positive bacteria)]|uniref:hypothetical protein n=1 Tax=Gordonia sp. (in: high G+C Gram-positive bacteria) TaxID=84139 RepID=UPI003C738CE9